MNTLYVIGNGFDLYHQLDTYYSSFGLFLQEKYPKYYSQLTRYLSLPELDEDDKGSLKDPLWADFENSFTRLDLEELLEEFSDYSASPSDKDFTDGEWGAYSVEINKIVKELTEVLLSYFKEFIDNVKYPGSSSPYHLKLDHNANFLCFNYTDTLERYYNIERNKILYIHGKAESTKGNLVLGHGIPPEQLAIKRFTPPEYLKQKEQQIWDYENLQEYDHSYILGVEEANQYVKKSFKHCEKIIEQNEEFFKELSAIQTIYILGHSLSTVDIQYFKKLASSIDLNSVTWKISYHLEEQQLVYKKTIMDLGVKEGKVELIKIDSLKSCAQLALF